MRIKKIICITGGRESGRCEVWSYELGERKAVVLGKGGSHFFRSQGERERAGERTAYRVPTICWGEGIP